MLLEYRGEDKSSVCYSFCLMIFTAGNSFSYYIRFPISPCCPQLKSLSCHWMKWVKSKKYIHMPWVSTTVVSTLAGPLFSMMMTIAHRPISWYLGLREDGQIALIISPYLCRPLLKALSASRMFLEPRGEGMDHTGSSTASEGNDSQTDQTQNIH